MMNDRFKYRIAVFERHNNLSDWVFKEYIKDNNNWHLTMCGDIADNGCYSARYRRDNAPDSVNMVYEAEFCTGLKDVEGNLIYEGDIVKTTLSNEDISKQETVVFVVYWSNEYGVFNGKIVNQNNIKFFFIKKDYLYYLLGNEEDKAEVIGNIYENADLIQECE